MAFCDVWGICGESIEGREREVRGEIEEGREEEGDRGEGELKWARGRILS